MSDRIHELEEPGLLRIGQSVRNRSDAHLVDFEGDRASSNINKNSSAVEIIIDGDLEVELSPCRVGGFVEVKIDLAPRLLRFAQTKAERPLSVGSNPKRESVTNPSVERANTELPLRIAMGTIRTRSRNQANQIVMRQRLDTEFRTIVLSDDPQWLRGAMNRRLTNEELPELRRNQHQ